MENLFSDNFARNNNELIGIEIEFQLLDKNTLDLADKVESLMSRMGDDELISHEVFQSCIEVKTKPVRNTTEARKEIEASLRKLKPHLDEFNLDLCSLGVHPFSKKAGTTTRKERYLYFEKEFPYITHHHLDFATQIHVGMSSLEESIMVMNRLRLLLPLFVALSASCPFWQEEETGFVSFRQYLLKSGLNGGTPPHFNTGEEFNRYLAATHRTGAVNSMKDIHWDIRPRPDLGTVELRIMDAVPTINEAMTLSAFAHTLMHALKTTSLEHLVPEIFSRPIPEWVESINYFQAMHLGIDALFILNSDGDNIKLKDMALKIFDAVEAVATELEEGEGIRDLRKMLSEGLPYQRMHRVFEKRKSYEDVVRTASGDLSSEMDSFL